MGLTAEQLRSLWVSPDEAASRERTQDETNRRRRAARLLAAPWSELEPIERRQAVRLARRRGSAVAASSALTAMPALYPEVALRHADARTREAWGRLRPEEIALDVRACHFIDALVRRHGRWRGARPPRRAITLLDEMNAAEQRYRLAQRALISFKAGTDGFPKDARPEDHDAFMGMIDTVRNDWHVRRMLFIAAAVYADERGRETEPGAE